MKRKGLKFVAIMFFVLVLSLGLAGFKSPKIGADSILLMDISGDIPEMVPYNPFWGLFEPAPITFLDKLMLLRKASADKRIQSVVITIRDNSLGMAKIQELRDAISNVKASAKPVYCYLEMEGDSDLSYYLASACTKIYTAPVSFLSINGLDSFYYFLGGLFQKAKLSIQVVKIKEYKTAGDMLSRRDMSPEHREMAESLLNSLWDQYLSGVSSARGKSKDEIAKLIDQYLVIPENYQEAGLIDGVKYLDDIIKELQAGKNLDVVKEKQYLNVPNEALGINMGPKVAVVYGVGSIVNQDPGMPPMMGSILSAEGMVKELEAVAKDDSVKAVIFRIDSGGGSALASDLIWRATQRVREKKPIVVSMSDVAGSGGYYIACGADAIVAEPGTFTGSIGVVSARIGMKELLGWLQVGTASLSKGAYAGMDDISRPWTDAEMAKADASIQGMYQVFLDRVSKGRKKSKDEINRIGRGRVWTGAQAKELGLVDELGGIDKAVEIVKAKLNVKDVNLVYKRKPLSLWKILTGKIEDEMVSMVFGPDVRGMRMAWQMSQLFKDGQSLFMMDEIVVK